MPNIALRHASKSYEGSSVEAVSDLSLEIAGGEFMCLLGPSGCGKTTTLRMIAGLENLSSGEIAIDDRVVDSVHAGIFVPPEQRDLGLVFQSYALWPHLTVERNTDFGLRLRRVPSKDRKERVDQVLTTLGIENLRDRYPAQLSGGQQQRVALARMLAVNPRVLLLDEPLSNLDARLRLEMRAELKRIHGEFGTTMVFVTHDQWEAMTLATRIAVMHAGTVQQVGTPNDVYERPANRFVAEFVGNPPINIAELGNGHSGGFSKLAREYVGNMDARMTSGVSVGLRPESIRLAKEDEPFSGRFAGAAAIAAVIPTGGSWIVELDVEGTKLFAATSQPPPCDIGDELFFQVERSALHVFDADGKRLRLSEERHAHEIDG